MPVGLTKIYRAKRPKLEHGHAWAQLDPGSGRFTPKERRGNDATSGWAWSLLQKLTRIPEVSMFPTITPRWVLAGLSALAVAACGTEGWTAPANAGLLELPERAGELGLVPFKAHYTWRTVTQTPLPGCDGPGEARTFLQGEGTATHLGRFTITLNHCGRPNLPLSDGHGTFVAANGDLLHITYFGVGGLTGAPPIFGFESRVAFAGGTGRYSDATGGATVLGTIDVRIGGGTGDWDGEISTR